MALFVLTFVAGLVSALGLALMALLLLAFLFALVVGTVRKRFHPLGGSHARAPWTRTNNRWTRTNNRLRLH